ncbi:MAG TPA: hypothetical protein EYG02_10580 [Henriciella marina]|uniref:hypothetical protein n=1 Tax=Henriciella sp. TaxID=1968823 RepID=UPI00182B19D0|nr:hypothetical protein [Henriciella sp.]HIG21155.1 hypothetical protein [Henriciella sp.]HIK65458.1 hypothetical protein [Henriciella marina]
MTEVTFKGPILPNHKRLDLSAPFLVNEAQPWGEQTQYSITAKGSILSVKCQFKDLVSQPSNSRLSLAYNRARMYGQSVLNVVALSSQVILNFMPDTFVDSWGNESQIDFQYPHLNGAWTFKRGVVESDIFNLLVGEPNALLALDDLIRGTENPFASAINCYRVIEALRHCLTPDKSEKAQWTELRRRLNVERSFIDVVRLSAANARHGQRVRDKAARNDDDQTRAWMIFDRFVHLRLMKDVDRLPELEFPMLS